LGGEVAKNIGKIAAPKGESSFLFVNPDKTITNALQRSELEIVEMQCSKSIIYLIRLCQSTRFDKLSLVLKQKLDTLNGGSSSF
jgi:hypothetical protein